MLKYILRDPSGPLYVMHAKHPNYIRAVRATEGQELLMRWTFSISAHVIDDIFLARVKELASDMLPNRGFSGYACGNPLRSRLTALSGPTALLLSQP